MKDRTEMRTETGAIADLKSNSFEHMKHNAIFIKRNRSVCVLFGSAIGE